MRARHVRPQRVTVRPQVDQTSRTNVFGDAPIDAAASRGASFDVMMAVSWNRNEWTNGGLGRQRSIRATAVLWKKDLSKPGRSSYVPTQNDMFELVTGEKLFVIASEPTGMIPVRLGSSGGGFAGWRVSLSDSGAEQRGATTYDS